MFICGLNLGELTHKMKTILIPIISCAILALVGIFFVCAGTFFTIRAMNEARYV